MASPPGGYDFITVHPVKDTFKCVICHLLLKQTTELPCNHVFCRSCLTRWEETLAPENQEDRQNRYDGNQIMRRIMS